MYHDNHELIRRQTSKRNTVEVQKPDIPYIVITNRTNYYTDFALVIVFAQIVRYLETVRVMPLQNPQERLTQNISKSYTT